MINEHSNRGNRSLFQNVGNLESMRGTQKTKYKLSDKLMFTDFYTCPYNKVIAKKN